MMDWGWPQWVLAAFFAIRIYKMVEKVKDESEVQPAAGFIALLIMGFIFYALHVGGFW